MRAVRRTDAGIEVVDTDEPNADGDDVIVEVRSAGICGTDLHMVEQGPLPATIGHEIAGVLADGRPVAIEPHVACHSCDQCIAGRGHLCRRGMAAAIGLGRDGGMAERIGVPPHCLVPLPAGLDPADASLVEPLAVSIHGLRIGGLEPGMRVAVVGGGTIGLCAVAAAEAFGCDVGLVARHPQQVAAGEQLGASNAEGEYDVVVDAAGSESGLATAVKLCRPAATLVVLSVHWGTLPLPGVRALVKELRVVLSMTYGHHAGGRDIDDAAALLASRPEVAPALITHRLPLEDAAEGFRVAADRAAGAIKVVLEPA